MCTVIWTCVFSILALFIIITVLLRVLYKKYEDENRSHYEIIVVKVFTWISCAICVLYSCLVLALRKRIALAIGIVEEAGKALASIPTIIFLPLVQTAGLVMFIIPWFIYMIYLASSGSIHSVSKYNSFIGHNVTYKHFDFDDNTKWAMLFLVFCLFWTSQFIIAIGQLIISFAVSCWYFTKDKSTVGNGTVLWASRITVMYYSGTAAFGSLLIAVLSTIKIALLYIQRKCKQNNNKFTECVTKCLICCMWCMESFVKFINKNAYIETAIHGYGFCQAAKSAFFLLLRNVLRVSAVNLVSDFVIMLGKFLVPALTTLICYVSIQYSHNDLKDEINGIYFIAFPDYSLFTLFPNSLTSIFVQQESLLR